MHRIRDKAEFLALVEEVDKDLKSDDVPIHARQIHGLMRVAQKTGENLTFNGEAVENVFTGSSLAAHVNKWFEARYGDRLKVDFSPGAILLLIREDLFLMRLPRVWGAIAPVADRVRWPRAPIFQDMRKGVPQCNVLDFIEGLAVGLRAVLTDDELKRILREFFLAMTQVGELEARGPLFEEISLDLRQGAKLATENALGHSRWHSLLAAEKALKLFMTEKGCQPEKIHALGRLHSGAVRAGMTPISQQLLVYAQCSPGVRYGEEISTPVDAFEAHSAARMIACEVAQQLPKTQKQGSRKR